MNELKEKLDRFMGSVKVNPPTEKLYEFLEELSSEGKFFGYSERDWIEAGRSYSMTDNEIAAWIETAASWLDDTTEGGEYEPEHSFWGSGGTETKPNAAPVTRGNPSKQAPSKTARRGARGFDALVDRLEDEYVTAAFPGLQSYAYEADVISIDEAKEIMDELLGDIVEISWPDGDHPGFRLKGEREWRSVQDSNDFPQPSTEPGPVDEGGARGEGESGAEEGLCYDDCVCPDPCDCNNCECGDGKVCCCECSDDESEPEEEESEDEGE